MCILCYLEDLTKMDTGASVRIFNLAKGLSASGNDVRLITPHFEDRCDTVDGITVFGLRGILPLAVLRVLRRLVHVEAPQALWFYDILFAFRAGEYIRDAEVVQIEGQSFTFLLMPFIKAISKKLVVVDCHDVFQALRLRNTNVLRKAVETFMEKLAYDNADLLLVVSESEKEHLFSAGFTGRSISVVPNGVNSSSFCRLPGKRRVRESYHLDSDPVVVFVGNLDYPPNREALQVLSSIIAPRVQSEIPAAKFVVVGKTRSKLDLPRLIFTGFVDSVSDVLNISEVAVAPILHGSGTRLKILEYLSCGLPVVSTSVGAEGLAVRDGVDLFLEDDFEGFSRRVVSLIRDKGYALALGERGRVFAETRYDWKIIVAELESSYRHLISGDLAKR